MLPDIVHVSLPDRVDCQPFYSDVTQFAGAQHAMVTVGRVRVKTHSHA